MKFFLFTSVNLLCRRSSVSNSLSELNVSGNEDKLFSLKPRIRRFIRLPISGGNVLNLFL